MIRLAKDITDFAKIFSENEKELFLVGGALRNMVAGMAPSDYDFATSAQPEQVVGMFKKVIPTGMKHGTVTVLFRRHAFEVTTFRVDGTYSNARHPDSIKYTSDIYEDLKRRDFSINAMALNISSGEFIDPHDGKKDLGKKIIRAIGDPVERFNEDGLRLLRACRFASQLKFEIEKSTLDGMKQTSANIEKVSAERIMEELKKIMKTDAPSAAFFIMKESGILDIILPELSDCIGIEQSGVHEFDVFRHCLYSCDAAPAAYPEIRLAALFHDIGKPRCKSTDSDGFAHFYNHEKVSAELAENIMKRLKFPNKVISHVVHLISHHMFNFTDEWSDSAVRRFISRVGKDKINDILKLRQADQYGFAAKPVTGKAVTDFRDRIRSVIESDSAFTVKDLAVNGREIMEYLGLKPGPGVGILLDDLLETVIDDPEQNKKEVLLKIAEKLYQSRIKKE